MTSNSLPSNYMDICSNGNHLKKIWHHSFFYIGLKVTKRQLQYSAILLSSKYKSDTHFLMHAIKLPRWYHLTLNINMFSVRMWYFLYISAKQHHCISNHWNVLDVLFLQQICHFVYSCLLSANEDGYTSIGFPAIGTGALEYPVDVVAKYMYDTVNTFAKNSPNCIMSVNLVLHDEETFNVSKSISYCFLFWKFS